MRKHFLILMLFALLPLAGWAYDDVIFKVGDDLVLKLETGQTLSPQQEAHNNAVTAFLTYNAEEKALPKPYQFTDQQDPFTEFLVSFTWYRATGSGNNAVKTGEAITKLEDAGTYVCEFVINLGNEQYNHSAILTIDKCMLDVEASNLTGNGALHYGDAFNADNVHAVFSQWPAVIQALSDAEKKTLSDSFGTVTYDTDYVPFESDVTPNEEDYYDVVPVITGLNSDNYDFHAVHGNLQVKPKDLSTLEATDLITNNNKNVFYKGAAAAPALTVQDAANSTVTLDADDYELLYFASSAAAQAYDPEHPAGNIEAPIHVGNYYFLIKGKGNYTGLFPTVFSYKVRPQRLEFTLKQPEIPYDAIAHELETLNLYDIEGIVVNAQNEPLDKISAIDIKLKDYNATSKKMEYFTTGAGTAQSPLVYVSSVTNVAKNTEGYQIAEIAIELQNNNDFHSVGNAADYEVAIMSEYFKITPAEIVITIKDQQMFEDESADITSNDGIAIVLAGQGANVDTYLRVSDVKKPINPNVITAYPNIKATKNAKGVWEIGFKDGKNPTVKASNAQDAVTVTDNYTFKINPGTLTIITDKGVLYVTPLAETYGDLEEEGYIKVRVNGGTDAANNALANLLNDNKVTPRVFTSENPAFAAYNGKILDVTAFVENPTAEILAAAKEYPNAGTYNVYYDPAVFETDEWTELAAEYDINLTGRPTYTISKRPLTITLYNQSLNKGDDVDDLVANKYTVKINNPAPGEAQKNFYAAVATNYEFDGHVTDTDPDNGNLPIYLTEGDEELNATAVAYPGERVNETDEAPTPGYFNDAISLNVAGLLAADAFANYTFTAADITKGGLFVSAEGVEFVLNLNYASKAEWDEEITATPALETHNADEIEDNNNHKVKTVKFDGFEMKAEKWYPMVLPFNTSVAELSEKFGYAVVNILNKENTDDAIRFKLHMQDIEANQPFLIKIYEDKVLNDANAPVEFTNKTIFDEDYSEDVNKNTGIKFVGFYDAKIGVTDHDFWFSHVPGYDARYGGKADANRFLRPLNAFVNTPANSIAKVIYVEDPNQGVTAIDEITTKGAEAVAVEGWYTINGMKLEGVPTEKGIYINNGKKIVIK